MNYSTTTRLAMTTVRNSTTKSEDFVLAWNDRLEDNIRAAVFDENGSIKYGPYILTSNENITNLLFDIYGRDSVADFGICDDSYILAYTNNTGYTVAKALRVDGRDWNRKCNA